MVLNTAAAKRNNEPGGLQRCTRLEEVPSARLQASSRGVWQRTGCKQCMSRRLAAPDQREWGSNAKNKALSQTRLRKPEGNTD